MNTQKPSIDFKTEPILHNFNFKVDYLKVTSLTNMNQQIINTDQKKLPRLFLEYKKVRWKRK